MLWWELRIISVGDILHRRQSFKEVNHCVQKCLHFALVVDYISLWWWLSSLQHGHHMLCFTETHQRKSNNLSWVWLAKFVQWFTARFTLPPYASSSLSPTQCLAHSTPLLVWHWIAMCQRGGPVKLSRFLQPYWIPFYWYPIIFFSYHCTSLAASWKN